MVSKKKKRSSRKAMRCRNYWRNFQQYLRSPRPNPNSKRSQKRANLFKAFAEYLKKISK